MVDTSIKPLCHLTILLLTLCFMMVKCSLEPTDQFIDNPTDAKQEALTMHKRPSFFVGSRYGRSGSSSASGSSLFATSKTRRLNVVPRNDRFFLSSRYGKRAGMDFLQNNINSNSIRNNNNNSNRKEYQNQNQNKNDYDYNDNSITIPLLSTPYEQALISEISTGTQLSSKPIPTQQQQQPQQQYNYDFPISHHGLQQSSSSSLPPYAYMSCVYTGLQNYYRCNSINSMLYLKSTPHNYDNNEEQLSNDTTGADLLNDDDNANTDTADDNDVNNVNDVNSDDDKK